MEAINLRLKKGLSMALPIIIVLVIVGYTNSYHKVSEETQSKITSIIKESTGEILDLQTDSYKVEWGEEAFIEQKGMMDNILNTLIILGESQKEKPNKYITATYNKMKLYIPYTKKTPHNNIGIEIDNHYFVATAKEDDVRTIISYIKKQFPLK
jgi:hypothetical protein